MSVNLLSILFNLPASTISTIIANKEKIVLVYENNGLPSKKRLKLSTYPLLETALDSWFKQTISHSNLTINGPVIKMIF